MRRCADGGDCGIENGIVSTSRMWITLRVCDVKALKLCKCCMESVSAAVRYQWLDKNFGVVFHQDFTGEPAMRTLLETWPVASNFKFALF
jgi:hypothetical protein